MLVLSVGALLTMFRMPNFRSAIPRLLPSSRCMFLVSAMSMLQGIQQSRALGAKFLPVLKRELLQDFFAVSGQMQQHLTAVFGSALPPDEAGGLQAIHQFDRTVMLDLQPFS